MTVFKTVLIIFLFLNIPSSFSLSINDDRKKIENYIKDAERIINESKRAIIKNISKNNINSVITIISHLYSYFHKLNITIFQPYEKWLLSIWTKQYHLVLKDTKDFNFSSNLLNRLNNENPENNFYRQLCRQTFKKRNKLIYLIRKSSLSISETEFLTLLLNKLINWGKDESIDQKTINKQSKIYMKKYRNSKFTSFIKEYIYVPIIQKDKKNDLAKNEGNPEEKSKWNFGIHIGLGLGDFNSKLSDLFTSFITIRFGVDFSYRKFKFIVSANICPGINVKETFLYNGIWGKDLPLGNANFSFYFGYTLYKNESISLTPYSGLSLSTISPPEETIKETGIDVSLGTLFGIVLGTNFEIYLGSSASWRNDKAYFALRLSVEYHFIQYSDEQKYFDGDLFFASIGIVGYINPW